MASSKLRRAASSPGDLPPDALYEILLRVPGKDLCRLRAVCRAWRALTSDPLFAAAHRSRHTAPLLALYYDDDKGGGFDIADLAGDFIRRVPVVGRDLPIEDNSGKVWRIPTNKFGFHVLLTRLDLVWVSCDPHHLFLLAVDPATGTTLDLPACHSEELAHELELGARAGRCTRVEGYAVGKVLSTGQHKVLRVTRLGDPGKQLCEVITLGDSKHGRWRAKQPPPFRIGTTGGMKCAVVDGVVYLLMDVYSTLMSSAASTAEPGSIASFNLETEEWMGTLGGPAPLLTGSPSRTMSFTLLGDLSLAELNGCLVTVHNIHRVSIDLWFLTDFEKGIWEKRYSMPPQPVWLHVYPFLLSDDCVFLHSGGDWSNGDGEKNFVRRYDRRTDNYADVLELTESTSIAIYTGSLLSL